MPTVKAEPAAPAGVEETEVRFERLLHLLRDTAVPKPKTRLRLLAYISTVLGGRLTEEEQLQKLEELRKRKVLGLDGKGRVTYPPAS